MELGSEAMKVVSCSVGGIWYIMLWISPSTDVVVPELLHTRPHGE